MNFGICLGSSILVSFYQKWLFLPSVWCSLMKNVAKRGTFGRNVAKIVSCPDKFWSSYGSKLIDSLWSRTNKYLCYFWVSGNFVSTQTFHSLVGVFRVPSPFACRKAHPAGNRILWSYSRCIFATLTALPNTLTKPEGFTASMYALFSTVTLESELEPIMGVSTKEMQDFVVLG